MCGRCLADVVGAAVQAGVSCVQLREKSLAARKFLAQAMMLKKLLPPHGVPLVINDRIDIALACGAEEVHLGRSDMPVEMARKLLPPDVFIGWSKCVPLPDCRWWRLAASIWAMHPKCCVPVLTVRRP